MKVICFQVIGDDGGYQTHIANMRKGKNQRLKNQPKKKAANEQLWKTLLKNIIYPLS